MTQFSFKNSSKSLSGNTFQEWCASFNAAFMHYCLTAIVAFLDSDKYTKGQVVNQDAICAVFPSSDNTRLNILCDKKLWGKFNKPMVTLDAGQIVQLVAGEEVTLSYTKYAFSLKLRNGKLAIQRAYKPNADSDLAVVHTTGLLVDVSTVDLTELANSLSDKPLPTKTAKPTNTVDLSDFD